MNTRILYDYVMSFVGLPYRWGGDDPVEGFDCSGLVIELLKSQGLFKETEDTTAQGLYDRYKSENTPIEFGTLAFFGKNVKSITHVGFCLNDWLMVEAGGGGSSTTSVEQAIKQNAYIKIRPIDRRTDLVGYARPPWNFETIINEPIKVQEGGISMQGIKETTGASWKFKVPANGEYEVSGTAIYLEAGCSYYLYKNGTKIGFMGHHLTSSAATLLLRTIAKKGDELEVRPSLSGTISGEAGGLGVTRIQIRRVGIYTPKN